MQLTAKMSARSFRPTAMAVALVLLACTGAAHAIKPISAGQSSEAIRTELQRIQLEATAGKRGWDNISAEKKTELTTHREKVVALLDGKKNAAELDEPQRAELTQALERINTLAKEADDQRMVCTRERKVGSNFPIETCTTVAERRRLRESSQESVQRQR